jgi:hypothetical protein
MLPLSVFPIILLSVTFNNISVISWRSVLLMEETEVPGENHRPAASHWQTCIEYTSSWTGINIGFWAFKTKNIDIYNSLSEHYI